MDATRMMRRATAFAVATMLAGCASWNHLDRDQKSTAVGAGSGAAVGAVVGGPVGAVVGAGVGGYVGHADATAGRNASTSGTSYDARTGAYHDSAMVRDVQQALNQRGYDVAVDGVWGPNTERALRDYQRANGLAQTGDIDRSTLASLGVNDRMAANPPASDNRTSGPAR